MEKILIIEDEKGIRDTLNEILDIAGYEVIVASNGKSGVEFVINEEPDLVLCDINMSDFNGFDVLNSLKSRFEGKAIPPFIYVTAKSELTDIKKGLGLGADDYILKPFKNDEIVERVRLRLNQRKTIQNNFGTSKRHSISVNKYGKLGIPCEGGLDLYNIEDIIKCQADRSYCDFTIQDQPKVTVSRPMKDFEDVLLSHGFLKVHRSTIVNLNHVVKYLHQNGGELLMSDDSYVPVSTRNKKAVFDLLRNNIEFK